MALKIAMAARNPFVLERVSRELLAAHEGDGVIRWGHSVGCMIEFKDDGTQVKLVSESDWRRGAYFRESFDQIFRVGEEPLGIDFVLELHECLRGSCVPEAWQWQKWEGVSGDG